VFICGCFFFFMETIPMTDSSLPTSALARRAAGANAGRRYQQILDALAHGPLAIFEVAAVIGCLDHQISGRFGELEREGLIIKLGRRVRKPSTRQSCELYGLRRPVPHQPPKPSTQPDPQACLFP
jgi:hypothetical protein